MQVELQSNLHMLHDGNSGGPTLVVHLCGAGCSNPEALGWLLLLHNSLG